MVLLDSRLVSYLTINEIEYANFNSNNVYPNQIIQGQPGFPGASGKIKNY
jgi:hypothetical protein